MNEKIRKTLQKAKQDKIYFAEHFLISPNGKPYQLEEHQKAFLKDQSPFKILFCSRRSGKSLLFQIEILHKLFFGKNENIGVLYPSLSQAKELSKTLDDIIYRSPLISSSFEVDNKFEKMLTNRNKLKIATAGTKSGQSEDSGQVGSGFTCLLLDEVQSMSSSSLSTIIPAVLGQYNTTSLLLSGTPRSNKDFFASNIENSFQITDISHDPITSPLKEGGVFSLHRFQVTDIDEYGNVLYTRSPSRLPISDLESVKSIIGVEKFKREFCLSYIDTSSLPFYDELVRSQGCLPKPDRFGSDMVCVGGLDLGKAQNRSVLCLGEYDADFKRWDIRFYKDWMLGSTYRDIAGYVNNMLPRLFPRLILLCVDATGVGKAVTESFDYHNTFNIKDIVFSQPMKVSLVENTVMNLETDYVRFYNHPILDREMTEYTRSVSDNGRVLFEKGESDDFIDAFTMCNDAITTVTNQGLLYRPNINVAGLGGSIADFNLNYRSGGGYGNMNLRRARERRV